MSDSKSPLFVFETPHERLVRARRNTQLWTANERTDPLHTKEVSFGRKFTAIDGYYQIKRATEEFGPFGAGWGYVVEEEVVHAADKWLAKIKLILWYIDPATDERLQCGPVIAMNDLIDSKGKADEEAFKKATTDALTKSLSYLGFSADIFMGKWEDSKYKTENANYFAKVREETAPLPPSVVAEIQGLGKIKTPDELKASFKMIYAEFQRLPPAQQEYVTLCYTRRRNIIAPPDTKDLADGTVETKEEATS